MLDLSYTTTAIKDLRGMPQADQQAVRTKLAAYAANPGAPADVKKLKGSALYRLRHGDWRAVFEVSKSEMTVLFVKHRREVSRR